MLFSMKVTLQKKIVYFLPAENYLICPKKLSFQESFHFIHYVFIRRCKLLDFKGKN